MHISNVHFKYVQLLLYVLGMYVCEVHVAQHSPLLLETTNHDHV